MNDNNINLDALIIRIGNSTSTQLKADLLRNAFSAQQMPYVEAWIKQLEEKERNAPVTLYHRRKAPSGKIFKAYELPLLEKKGWVDSPTKFKENIFIRIIGICKKLILKNTHPAQNKITASADNWYKTPVGIVILSVLSIIIAAFIVFAIRYYFPNLKLMGF
jgi:hypothetical protein